MTNKLQKPYVLNEDSPAVLKERIANLEKQVRQLQRENRKLRGKW